MCFSEPDRQFIKCIGQFDTLSHPVLDTGCVMEVCFDKLGQIMTKLNLARLEND